MDADTLVAALRAAWDSPNPPRSWRESKPHRPLAGGPYDQAVPDGVRNPLWEIVRLLPAEEDDWFGGPHRSLSMFMTEGLDAAARMASSRTSLVKRYAWSVPSPGDMAWMRGLLNGRGVVEVGAGSGYWAWQLEQAGVDVVAYDPAPPGEGDNHHVEAPVAYTTVLRDDASAVSHHPDRALLLCWPSYDAPWAAAALAAYQGDLLFYAGEGGGGCTADDAFFDFLDKEWDEISESPHHVTWWGIHCHLIAYRRRRT
jgi:hypothetical protein